MRVGIVGTGNVAQNSYLPFLTKETGVSLGYYNRTRARADACAGRFGGQVFGSVDELMAWDPDTVLVLTRETQRLEAAEELLAHRPKRLFFEKPLVARRGQAQVGEQDFRDGRRLLQQAEAIGCQTAMVFNYRFFEHSQMARRVVAERDFGRLRNATALVHYACWSHAIDLVHFFAGPIAQVSALEGAVEHEGGGMRARDITAAFRTADEGTGTLIGTNTLAWEFPLFELSLNFERGRLRMQDLDGDLEVMDVRGGEVERYGIARGRSRWDQYTASFGKAVSAYLASVRAGAAAPVAGWYGLLELQVEAGLKRSAASGRPVVLADEFPLGIATTEG